MIVYLGNKCNCNQNIQGRGLLIKTINSLSFELNLPGTQNCGPGTKLEKRLQRGDKEIDSMTLKERIKN